MNSGDADSSENVAASFDKDEVYDFRGNWEFWARPEQLPPGGDWTTWLLLGGRGAGKTRAGAEWIRMQASAGISPIALVGETLDQARAVMVEGESGLLAVHGEQTMPRLDRSRGLLKWPNGVEAQLMSGSDPDRFRGPQFAAAWCDEAAKWPDAEAAWDMLQFALRLGRKPRQVVTTTPRPTKLIKRLLKDPHTIVTRMRTEENRRNLAPGFLDAVVGRYRGSVLGRQELDGELIDDVPDALWRRAALEAGRVTAAPDLERIVVAVDPPVTSHGRSDACGIVAAGRLGDTGFVLADRTLKPAPPLRWSERAVALFYELEADAIVAETNQGGDLVAEMIRQADANVPVTQVRATRGKWLRAEPVAALYARGRVHHVPGLNELEDEMCAFTNNGLSDGHSPDRVDALVWALTELMPGRREPRVRGV